MKGYAVKCDECGNFRYIGRETIEDGVLPKPWINILVGDSPTRDFCSPECAIKFLSKQPNEATREEGVKDGIQSN